MRMLALSALLAAVSTPAFAAQGEVCATEPKSLGPTDTVFELTNDTVFKCPTAGDVTVPQVYQKGWRVVQVAAGMAAAPTGAPGSMPRISHVMVIEKL